MVRVAKFIRRWARFIAGAAFWLHAVLILTIPTLSLETLAGRVGLNVPEMLLGLFFLSMALLNGYGFWKFLLDLIYIYFFPFILIYNAAVIIFKVASHIPAHAARFLPRMRSTFTWMATLREFVPDDSPFIALSPTPPVSVPVMPVTNTISAVSEMRKKRNFWLRISLPLRSFTIAWCLLIVATDKPMIMLVGVIVLAIHLIRLIVNLARRLASARQFLKDAETNVVNRATNLLNTLMNASDEMLTNPDVLQAVSFLGLFRGSAFLLINRIEISYLFFLAGVLLYFAVYARIAILFGFVYLGVAKLNHIPLSFLDAMVNSFAMPLSYTNYPRYWLLQLSEDIHSLVVIALGFGALSAYMRQKAEAFRGVAEDLWVKLDRADVRSRMAYAAKRGRPINKAPSNGAATG